MNHDFSRDPVGCDQIFSCAHCGRLVLRFVFWPRVLLWDPTFTQRRFVRSHLPRKLVEDVGFGPRMGEPHICALVDLATHAAELRRIEAQHGEP